MNCPQCDFDDSKVVDSRDVPGSIRRRRQCLECTFRFTTYEKVHIGSPLMVVKADGRREPFQHDKLEKSVRIACTKRKLSALTIDKMVGQVEYELYRLGNREVDSNTIGKITMAFLSSLDRVAYIRYASVYHDFPDENSFTSAVNELQAHHDLPRAQTEMPLKVDERQARQVASKPAKVPVA